jgi:hypothetical protein
MEKVNLTQKFSLFHDYWSPPVVGELNDSYVKVAKLKGEKDITVSQYLSTHRRLYGL